MPEYKEEDSIGPLSGRAGSAFSCKNCFAELKFIGKYS
jgi:hypothetical protein